MQFYKYYDNKKNTINEITSIDNTMTVPVNYILIAFYNLQKKVVRLVRYDNIKVK